MNLTKICLGDHVYFKESENIYDHAMHTFATLSVDRVIKGALNEIPEALASYEEEQSGGQIKMRMGFALRTSRTRTRFSTTVRNFLIEKFDQGEKTGKKFDPRNLARDMRTAQ